jgi:hypothetical protein
MSKSILVRTNVRMWSQTVALAPVAAHAGLRPHIVRAKGDMMRSAKGKPVNLRAPEYYLSSAEVTAKDLRSALGQIAEFARLLTADSLVSRLVANHELDVVVWSAIFGDQGAATIAELDVDRSPFGSRVGLVVENYADFDKGGNPRKLLIGPSASRKTAISTRPT